MIFVYLTVVAAAISVLAAVLLLRLFNKPTRAQDYHRRVIASKIRDRHVFVSYKQESLKEAYDIRCSLEEMGLEVSMYDPENLYDDPISEIPDRIMQAPVLVLVKAGGRKSEWVEAELDYTRKLNKLIVEVCDANELPKEFAKTVHREFLRAPNRVPIAWRQFDALQAFSTRASDSERGISHADISKSEGYGWELREAEHDDEIWTEQAAKGWCFIGFAFIALVAIVFAALAALVYLVVLSLR